MVYIYISENRDFGKMASGHRIYICISENRDFQKKTSQTSRFTFSFRKLKFFYELRPHDLLLPYRTTHPSAVKSLRLFQPRRRSFAARASSFNSSRDFFPVPWPLAQAAAVSNTYRKSTFP